MRFILALLLLFPSAAGDTVSLINATRAANGLAPLSTDSGLSAFAQNHSQNMAAAGEIFHSPNLGSASTGWDALGENVGKGGTASALHDAFMASSGHRANILGDWNYIGVGTAEGDALYITVVFMKKGGTEPPPETTTTQAASAPLVPINPTPTTVPQTTTTSVPVLETYVYVHTPAPLWTHSVRPQ